MTGTTHFNSGAATQPEFEFSFLLEHDGPSVEFKTLEEAQKKIIEHEDIYGVQVNITAPNGWLTDSKKTKIREITDDNGNGFHGAMIFDSGKGKQKLLFRERTHFSDTKEAIEKAQELLGLCVMHGFIDEKSAQSVGWDDTYPTTNKTLYDGNDTNKKPGTERTPE